MTREEMATTVALSAETCRGDASIATEHNDEDSAMWATLRAIALEEVTVELRKTCAACQWFQKFDTRYDPIQQACCSVMVDALPMDGSGFCHNWKAKP